jgi:hypothetical protein
MSAVIADFRLYQSARDFGRRAGIPQREAVQRVNQAIRDGMTGRVAVGQLHHEAMRGNPRTPGPEAA